ncbi:hypothetical protein F5B18DRAFT_644862 [Nemania serpens]|nr:hypothetical protein F5B18DRAFT_644862 [Nemania serpens]
MPVFSPDIICSLSIFTSRSFTVDSMSRFGLKVLRYPAPKCTLDVVAVHGLNGDCRGSWTSNGPEGSVLWLDDLLPKKIPTARIMTFGYNADVVGNTSVAGIRDNARKLLESIRDEREDDQETDPHRPIVFVGHSLGGIIIKQALRIANNEARLYDDIASSTKGILFFATPHRGADVAKWVNMIACIAAFSLRQPKSKFIQAMESNSKDLMEISEDFRSIVDKYAIISFYEENVYPTLGTVVVEKYSAVMEVSHEEAVLMGGNHSEVCKFGNNDDRFDQVWRRIKRAARGRA